MPKDDIVQLGQLFDAIGLKEHSIEKSESDGSPLSSSFRHDAEDFLHAAEDAF